MMADRQHESRSLVDGSDRQSSVQSLFMRAGLFSQSDGIVSNVTLCCVDQSERLCFRCLCFVSRIERETKVVKCIQTALRIVNQLFRGKPTEYISNSGKGDKEVSGRFVRLEKSVRGLTVIVSADGVERRVCWRMSDYTADYVLRLAQGYAIQVSSSYLSTQCDDGTTTLREFLNWCQLVHVITYEQQTGVIRLADGVNG